MIPMPTYPNLFLRFGQFIPRFWCGASKTLSKYQTTDFFFFAGAQLWKVCLPLLLHFFVNSHF